MKQLIKTKLKGAALLAAAMLAAGAPAIAMAHTNDDTKASLGASIAAHVRADLRHVLHWDKRDKNADATGGTVTSVDGSTFVIDPLGSKTSTTITTNADTVFKTKGGATTSAAVQNGSKVVVVGTTTASSTSGDSITASVVVILGKWFHSLGVWFSVR